MALRRLAQVGFQALVQQQQPALAAYVRAPNSAEASLRTLRTSLFSLSEPPAVPEPVSDGADAAAVSDKVDGEESGAAATEDTSARDSDAAPAAADTDATPTPASSASSVSEGPSPTAPSGATPDEPPDSATVAASSAANRTASAAAEAASLDKPWDAFLQRWAVLDEKHREKEAQLQEKERLRSERDDIQKRRDARGHLEFAADNTAEPLPDTRVWLHMYEGENGLEYSFDRNTGAAHYMYDFTGFQEWHVEQNALLSDESKCLMFKLWANDPEVWSERELAAHFHIRVQRALAIVKIKQEEFSQADVFVRALNELQEILKLPQQPSIKEIHRDGTQFTMKHLTAWFDPWLELYELLPYLIHPDSDLPKVLEDDEHDKRNVAQSSDQEDKRVVLSRQDAERVITLHNHLAKGANAEAKHIATHEDLWRCVYHFGAHERYIPMAASMPAFEEFPADSAESNPQGEFARLFSSDAAEQDEAEIKEFTRNLMYNLGETGQTIQRRPRKRSTPSSTLPRKPDGGWPLLVTPLHAHGRRGEPFVATPDGTQRPLNADEDLYLRHFKLEPKIFSRPRRHAPYTNRTLHMFNMRKPNPRHDLYNPRYKGVRRAQRSTSGPSAGEARRRRVRAHEERRNAERMLAGQRL